MVEQSCRGLKCQKVNDDHNRNIDGLLMPCDIKSSHDLCLHDFQKWLKSSVHNNYIPILG